MLRPRKARTACVYTTRWSQSGLPGCCGTMSHLRRIKKPLLTHLVIRGCDSSGCMSCGRVYATYLWPEPSASEGV